ncbi:MAG: IS200/IS605 family transposase [Janthinobacterium lividum]
MELTYKTNNNICYSCKYHVVWCPKYRKKILIGKVEERLKAIVYEICKETRADLIEIECDEDHIHILVDIDPQYGIHRLIKLIKGRSAFLLRKEFPFLRKILPCMWTNSYFVSTVGVVSLEVVKQYIENQKLRSI